MDAGDRSSAAVAEQLLDILRGAVVRQIPHIERAVTAVFSRTTVAPAFGPTTTATLASLTASRCLGLKGTHRQ
jgi:hypothetical protein